MDGERKREETTIWGRKSRKLLLQIVIGKASLCNGRLRCVIWMSASVWLNCVKTVFTLFLAPHTLTHFQAIWMHKLHVKNWPQMLLTSTFRGEPHSTNVCNWIQGFCWMLRNGNLANVLTKPAASGRLSTRYGQSFIACEPFEWEKSGPEKTNGGKNNKIINELAEKHDNQIIYTDFAI